MKKNSKKNFYIYFLQTFYILVPFCLYFLTGRSSLKSRFNSLDQPQPSTSPLAERVSTMQNKKQFCSLSASISEKSSVLPEKIQKEKNYKALVCVGFSSEGKDHFIKTQTDHSFLSENPEISNQLQNLSGETNNFSFVTTEQINQLNNLFTYLGENYLNDVAQVLELVRPGGVQGCTFTANPAPHVLGVSIITPSGQHKVISRELFRRKVPEPLANETIRQVDAFQSIYRSLKSLNENENKNREALSSLKKSINNLTGLFNQVTSSELEWKRTFQVNFSSVPYFQLYSGPIPRVGATLGLGLDLYSQHVALGIGKVGYRSIGESCFAFIYGAHVGPQFHYSSLKYSGFGVKTFLGVGVVV